MMKMSRSPYIDSVVLTSKHSGRRTHKVQAFVIHHMAAHWTGKQCAEYFRDTPGRQASTNYAIGYDGDVALNVEEHNRAWTSGSNWADQRAITFELANSSMGHPWRVSDKTIDKAIVMLAELHQRYGLKEASYTGNTNGTLWRHDWFQSTNCPGPYLGSKLAYMADEINKILRGGTQQASTSDVLYRVQAGAFEEKENADQLLDKLQKEGIDAFVLKEGPLYKVQAGAYRERENATDQLDRVKQVAGDAFITPTEMTTSSKVTAQTKPKKTYSVTVDGYLGPETVRALQDYFGLVVDGEMWGQYRGNQATAAFNQRSVRYGAGGSPVVTALQRKIGASPVDGIWGAGTTHALQGYLGTPVDGEIWRPSTAIKELQRRLNNGTF